MKDFSFLFDLERELHDGGVRANVKRLEELLSPSFFEFGSSGTIWTLEMTLKKLPEEKRSFSIESENYKAVELSDGVVLVTYVTKITGQDGAREALRSSIWRKNSIGWQIEFHQGTPRKA